MNERYRVGGTSDRMVFDTNNAIAWTFDAADAQKIVDALNRAEGEEEKP